MCKLSFFFAAAAVVAGLSGCSGPETKLARGVDNTMEIIRWGDMRQSYEEGAVFSAPEVTYSHGIIHGFDQSIKRTGVGIFETVTFFIPNYHVHGEDRWNYKDPVFVNSIPANPQYPDSYRPGIISASTFDTDTYTGFSGGDVAPFIPGSRFTIFDD